MDWIRYITSHGVQTTETLMVASPSPEHSKQKEASLFLLFKGLGPFVFYCTLYICYEKIVGWLRFIAMEKVLIEPNDSVPSLLLEGDS
ncbi:hypothetical protein V6N13_138824 [Hibiscus sabdariffa]